VAVDSLEEQSTTPAGKALLAIYEGGGGCFRGFRASHAKGTLYAGRFHPSLQASRLTTAPHMQGEPVAVTVRFSNAATNPHSLDYSRDVRGMATKFYLPDAGDTDILAITLPCFFVKAPAKFPDFALAQASKLGGMGYALRHASALRAAGAYGRLRPPASYANCRYHAIHAYRWTDARGGERYVRYSWIPLAGEETIAKQAARSGGENYLEHEIQARFRAQAVKFRLRLQLAGPGDSPTDPTTIWQSPQFVDAGTLVLTAPDVEHDEAEIAFDPTKVTAGIACSADPILGLRHDAYGLSVAQRREGTCP
jgi:catalase